MTPHPTFLFDGSFAGFLTAVHSGFVESLPEIRCTTPGGSNSLELFGPQIKIKTNTVRAKQLWGDLGLVGTEVQKRVYYSFLHKNTKLQSVIYQYTARQLSLEIEAITISSGIAGSQLDIATQEVSRERGELEKNLEFHTCADGLWYAEIQPKHNITPLLSRFCRSRFQTSSWMVVDTQRRQSLSSFSGELTLSSYTASPEMQKRMGVVADAHPLLQRSAALRAEGLPAKLARMPKSDDRSFQNRDLNRAWVSSWGQRAV